MESWRKTLAQFRDLYRSMAPSQRMLIVVLPALVLAGLGLVMYLGVGAAEEPLSYGKTFSADELKAAQDALQKAGLSQFRIDGQKILVAKSDAPRYNAALITGDAMPSKFGDEMLKTLESNSLWWGTDKQRTELMEVVKARELRKIILSIPEIEDAGILWQKGRPTGFERSSKMTAMLSVRPKGGRELTSDLTQSLRLAVAGAYGMAEDDVIVINTGTGKASRGRDKNDLQSSDYFDEVRRFTELHRQNIAQALHYIPNVVVAVNVELDNVVRSRDQERRIEKKPSSTPKIEETENEIADETRPASEPGMTPNQPRFVRPQAAHNTTRYNEKSRTGTENIPIGTKLTSKDFFGLTPKSVQVTVAIPKDYYRAIAREQPGADEGDKAAQEARIQRIKTEVEKDVSQKLALLVPIPVGGKPEEIISVSSYDRLETAEPPVAMPLAARVGEALAQYGGPIALACFALWALWMLGRTMKRAPDHQEGAAGQQKPPATRTHSPVAIAATPEETAPAEPTRRDKLQTRVRDNPENDDLLEQSLGKEKAGAILENIKQSLSSVPFGFLHKSGADSLLTFIVEEHPQTIALILSHLPNALAAQVLSGLPSQKQLEVVRRVASMEQTSPEVVRDVEKSLESRMTTTFNQHLEKAGGVSAVAQMLAVTDRTTNKAILDNLLQESPELVDQIRRLMFVFDDLLKLDDQAIRGLLKDVDNAQWALALKGASEELKQKIMSNLSQRAAAMLVEEMQYLGPVRVSDVEAAQQQVVDTFRRLEDSGEIVIAVGSESDRLIA